MFVGELIPVIAVVVVVLAVRTRRTMKEQPFHSATVWARIILLCALAIFVLIIEMRSRETLAGVAAGLIIGLLLGGYSLSHTTYNWHEDPPRYKTNPYIGAMVVALFAIRILYDALTLRAATHHVGPIDPITVSWFSALLYFLFIAYWNVYYIGLLRRVQEKTHGKRP